MLGKLCISWLSFALAGSAQPFSRSLHFGSSLPSTTTPAPLPKPLLPSPLPASPALLLPSNFIPRFSLPSMTTYLAPSQALSPHSSSSQSASSPPTRPNPPTIGPSAAYAAAPASQAVNQPQSQQQQSQVGTHGTSASLVPAAVARGRRMLTEGLHACSRLLSPFSLSQCACGRNALRSTLPQSLSILTFVKRECCCACVAGGAGQPWLTHSSPLLYSLRSPPFPSIPAPTSWQPTT